MSTMQKFCEAKSDQLNGDDLISGNRVIKITKVKVTATGQQDCVISYEGDNGKPWKPCKSMGRVIVFAWGSDPQAYVGRSIELFRDPEAIFAGQKVGGIRIAAMSDVEADFDVSLTVSRGVKRPVRIKKLKSAPKASQEIIDAGHAASVKGTVALAAWKDSLPDKEIIRPHYTAWYNVAKAADEQNKQATST